MKTSEEIADAFEEIEEGVIACTNSNGGLLVMRQEFITIIQMKNVKIYALQEGHPR